MKILVFSASTGGGHRRAAAALKEYIEANSENTEVRISDGLALSGKAYNKFICNGYTTLAKLTPKFYGRLYISSDKESKLSNLCNNVNRRKGRHLLPEIESFKPDVII